jgi:dihydrofolate synthase / folylpolyglutamate synthase
MSDDPIKRSFDEWLRYQNQIHSLSMDFTLERIRSVLARLSLLNPKGVVVTVGGTNGKGSVTAMIESIARAMGLSTGLYSSPHLIDYSERIKVNGEPVAHEVLVDHFERIERARGTTTLTFFEYATATALSVFAERGVDLTILEVGLGGRLDAVNVIDADVAVVVSISLDHCEWLGDSVEKIGYEKAGVFRKNRPAIFAALERPKSIDEQALAIGASLHALGRDYHLIDHGECFDVKTPLGDWLQLAPPALLGNHQKANAAAAILALSHVRSVSEHAIREGLKQVRLRGRFERHQPSPTGPMWVFDVAHNEGSVKSLVETVSAQRAASTKVFWVCGLLMDKDAEAVALGMASALHPHDELIAVGIDGERGRSGVELAATWQKQLAHPIRTSPTIEVALAEVRNVAARGDWVVVFGSFHVVGPALMWFEETGQLGG